MSSEKSEGTLAFRLAVMPSAAPRGKPKFVDSDKLPVVSYQRAAGSAGYAMMRPCKSGRRDPGVEVLRVSYTLPKCENLDYLSLERDKARTQ